MGRNLKYKEQTVLFAKKVPKSKLEAIKKLVSDYLVNDIEVVGVDIDSIKTQSPTVYLVPKDYNFENACSCKIENNLFIRSKGCKLSKEEHKF